MGVLDKLICCIRKKSSEQEDNTYNNDITYKQANAGHSSSTLEHVNKSTSSDLKHEEEVPIKFSVNQSESVRERRQEEEKKEYYYTSSLDDVTLSVVLEQNPSPGSSGSSGSSGSGVGEAAIKMSEISRTSSGVSRDERRANSRNVNIVRPRMFGSREDKISLSEDIDSKYDAEHYQKMISRSYTSMSTAYNREDNEYQRSRWGSGYGERFTSNRESDSGTKVYSLLQAACKGDLNSLQKLCHEGVDMGTADYDGRRALHLSASEGHLDCVKFLLEKCNVPHSPRDRWYHTPLDEARTFKREAVVNYLDELITKEEEKERGAKTYLLLNSACSGDIRTLKRLYQEGVDMKLSDYDGRTCLHLCAAEGHLDCLRFLLEQCEVPHSPKDRWFHTPLDEAQQANHAKCAEFLDDYIQQYDAKKEGASVYSILTSASKGDTRTLEKLARDGEDMAASDYDGRTALHLAAAEGHVGVVTFLLEKCKVDANPKDRWQHTPLDEAKNAKNDTVIKYLERHVSNKTKIISDSKPK